MKTLNRAALLSFLLLVVPSAWAGTKLINVQGKLTNSAGKPLGSATVTFRLYNSLTAPMDACTNAPDTPNACIWMESKGITTQNGVFNITLGQVKPLDPIPFDKPYYLGMQVAGDANELQPRQLLGASTHAHPIAADGSHSHAGWTGNISAQGTRVADGSGQYNSSEAMQDTGTGGSFDIRLTQYQGSISADGTHSHGGTGSASNMPPYVTVVFCQKQ